MKITMCTTGINQIQGGNGSQNGAVTQNQSKFQFPLNPKAMDVSNAVAYDQYITVPYQDPTLLQNENIHGIVTRIAEQTDWVFPDYDRTKFNLVIEVAEDFEIISTALQIIARPPVYTDEQKADILKHETDNEMFETWQEIFYHADDFYKDEDRHFDESYEEIEIELDEEEMR